MSCSYSIYLIIMYFNPRIEAWLYKITNTNSPEFKSDLHASNGIKANNYGYQKIADEEQSHSEGKEKKPLSSNEQTNSAKETPEEKGDGKKEEKHQEERKEDGGEKQPLKGKVYNVIGNRKRPGSVLQKQEQDRRSLFGDSFDGGFFVLLIVRFS